MSDEKSWTRLYRCEPIPTGHLRPEWIAEAQKESGHAAAEGRWFVADPSMLDWYREDASGPMRTVYIDVPTGDLDSFRVSNNTEQLGHRPVKSYSRDPENEFFLPRELAEGKRELHGDREALLRETFEMNRAIGFAGFREQFIGDPDAIKEWPDPAAREDGIRAVWDGQADYEKYRQGFDATPTGHLAEYRDSLVEVLADPASAHIDYSSEAVERAVAAREAESSPLAPAMEAAGNSKLPESIRAMEFDYHKMLEFAANQGKHAKKDVDKGVER